MTKFISLWADFILDLEEHHQFVHVEHVSQKQDGEDNWSDHFLAAATMALESVVVLLMVEA